MLYPAIAEAARRVGANTVGLIDVGCSAGLNLNVDRVGITYSNGQSLGDPSSPVQLSSSIVGDGPIPTRAMPEVVARVGVDLDPVDVTDADDARWLRACLWPDQPERVARLDAEMALAATAPPGLLQGDAVEVVPDAFARVPADALPVVTTTWALSRFTLESRLRFLHRLDEAAACCAVARLSVEGVGVAPAIPTLGDRRASGHSIIGLALLDRLGFARRGHWPGLVAGPLPGVAGRLLVPPGAIAPSTGRTSLTSSTRSTRRQKCKLSIFP